MALSRFPHAFPKGFKQYRIMNLMMERNGLTHTEIIKIAFELDGKNKFDKVANRGYWSGAFKEPSNYPWSSDTTGWVRKYCFKGDDGKWRVSTNGMPILRELDDKFGYLSVEDALNLKKGKKEKQEEDERMEKLGELKKAFEEHGQKFKINFKSGDTIRIQEVKLRGLDLYDNVLYYRKFDGTSGEATVEAVTNYIKEAGKHDELTLVNTNGACFEVAYNPKGDRFYEKTFGTTVEIIKK